MLDEDPLIEKAHNESDLSFGTVDSWLVYVRLFALDFPFLAIDCRL